jgi:hypothetical protein
VTAPSSQIAVSNASCIYHLIFQYTRLVAGAVAGSVGKMPVLPAHADLSGPCRTNGPRLLSVESFAPKHIEITENSRR